MRTPPLSPAEASLSLPLPRPPAWIWLFTTQTGPGRALAAPSASAGFRTGTPLEIATPNSLSSALAWYSWIFIWSLPEPAGGDPMGPPQSCGWHTIYHRNYNPDSLTSRFWTADPKPARRGPRTRNRRRSVLDL